MAFLDVHRLFVTACSFTVNTLRKLSTVVSWCRQYFNLIESSNQGHNKFHRGSERCCSKWYDFMALPCTRSDLISFFCIIPFEKIFVSPILQVKSITVDGHFSHLTSHVQAVKRFDILSTPGNSNPRPPY